ncbi:HNH endonuclease [Tsukamurella paurometabola]|uniref:HNH endonuclease n=1 Tax=Tsukamurella paurometabola TaxID=2061 RepID=A0A3P8JVV8_TSUPA|nr:HNH endonuclease [Tsukamurella paurometabola]
MSRWNDGGRYHGGFPTSVRREARRTLPMRCARCGADNAPLELDHIVNAAAGGTNDLTNAQWLCTDCHAAKTKTEALHGATARRARLRLPVEPHPGLAPRPTNTPSNTTFDTPPAFDPTPPLGEDPEPRSRQRRDV